MRGRAMRNSFLKPSATIRTVSTISSGVSAPGTEDSGMWMVTGTTRKSGAAIIMTERGVPVRAARNSVWPGCVNPAA